MPGRCFGHGPGSPSGMPVSTRPWSRARQSANRCGAGRRPVKEEVRQTVVRQAHLPAEIFLFGRARAQHHLSAFPAFKLRRVHAVQTGQGLRQQRIQLGKAFLLARKGGHLHPPPAARRDAAGLRASVARRAGACSIHPLPAFAPTPATCWCARTTTATCWTCASMWMALPVRWSLCAGPGKALDANDAKRSGVCRIAAHPPEIGDTGVSPAPGRARGSRHMRTRPVTAAKQKRSVHGFWRTAQPPCQRAPGQCGSPQRTFAANLRSLRSAGVERFTGPPAKFCVGRALSALAGRGLATWCVKALLKR